MNASGKGDAHRRLFWELFALGELFYDTLDSVGVTKRTVGTYLPDWVDNAIVTTDHGTGQNPNRYIWNG